MRVIAAPHDVADAKRLDRFGLVARRETRAHRAVHRSSRRGPLQWVAVGAEFSDASAVERASSIFQHVRDPTGPLLRHHELEPREPLEDTGEDDVPEAAVGEERHLHNHQEVLDLRRAVVRNPSPAVLVDRQAPLFAGPVDRVVASVQSFGTSASGGIAGKRMPFRPWSAAQWISATDASMSLRKTCARPARRPGDPHTIRRAIGCGLETGPPLVEFLCRARRANRAGPTGRTADGVRKHHLARKAVGFELALATSLSQLRIFDSSVRSSHGFSKSAAHASNRSWYCDSRWSR